MINHNGFSPSKIEFKKKNNLPNNMNDTLPALEKVITSADLALHIATVHSARQAFMKAQTSEKIKIALKKQTQQTQERYKISEEVYYKRNIGEQWKGPVNVLGQDESVVFLQNGRPIIPENEKCNKNIDRVQEDKNTRSISELDSDSEMDTNKSTI